MWSVLKKVSHLKQLNSLSFLSTSSSRSIKMSEAVTTHPRGASIHSILVPAPSSSSASPTNILLGFPHPDLFATHSHPFFGETIGRMTNRIGNARLTNLNGKNYDLFANEGTNNLHGGKEGWGKKTWEKKDAKRGKWDSGIEGLDKSEGERNGVLYTYTSPDGDEGFPGTLEARVWYFEGRGKNGEVVLDVEYEVEFAKGVNEEGINETVIGLTNHA